MSKTKIEQMKLVPGDYAFKFKKSCPYCGGNLTYTCEGWEEDKKGRWMSDGSFDVDCSNEPEDIDSEEWNEWLKRHTYMPYVFQLPVNMRVEKYINSKYRFILKA